jgi:methyl-accepting chemotaxis protein
MYETINSLLSDNRGIASLIFRFLPWLLLVGWFLYSLLVVFSGNLREKISNFYIVESIPSVFVTLGLFGTFLGITYGLLTFDTSPGNVSESIDPLIEGISTAMLTSITGIFLSLVSSKFIKVKMKSGVIREPESPELLQLQLLNKHIKELKEARTDAFAESIKNALHDFNELFSNLIEDLVKQNFEELNKTINELNNWQRQHKEDVDELKNAYKSLVENHRDFVNKTNEWVEKLDQISGQSSRLQTVIDEFNSAFEEDGNLSKMVKEIQESAERLKQVTGNYSELTQRMNDTVENIALTGDKIDQWTTSVQSVSEDSKQIVDNVKQLQYLEGNFDQRLQKTFESFDSLINEYIDYLENKMEKEK